MKFICVSENYSENEESQQNSMFQSDPILFLKMSNSLLTGNKPFRLKKIFQQVVHKFQLVVKICKTGKKISLKDASGYYNEVTVGIDLTDEGKQKELKAKGLPWELSNAFDHSAVIGKFIPVKEAMDEFGSISFKMTSKGKTIQQGNNREMIHNIESLICYASKYFTLEKGDMIMTGSPAGINDIQIGDNYKGFINDKCLFTCGIQRPLQKEKEKVVYKHSNLSKYEEHKVMDQKFQPKSELHNILFEQTRRMKKGVCPFPHPKPKLPSRFKIRRKYDKNAIPEHPNDPGQEDYIITDPYVPPPSQAVNYTNLIRDLKDLVKTKKCGPILVRLSFQDACVYSTGKLTGGCPNAAMRFKDGGEGQFDTNTGLPDVALGILKEIEDKYCKDFIGHADLWALAANIAIEMCGGPKIKTRYGRKDAKDHKDSVESQEGRLPSGNGDAQHLRDIFYPKGFTDADIVALSGAHTLGGCHLDRTGYEGSFTENPQV